MKKMHGGKKISGRTSAPPMRKAAGESRGAKGQMSTVKRVASGSVNAGDKLKKRGGM